jgi:hypothetical protein
MPLLKTLLNDDLGVAENYRHGKKKSMPGAQMETTGAILKWYALAPADQPVPEEIDLLARVYLTKAQLEAKGFGFVILHRCGSDFYFLIVST